MSEKQGYDVTLEADFTDPALAPAAFQLLRQAGVLYGLPNVGWIRLHMTVEVDGCAYPSQIEGLKKHFDTLWFGGVESVKVRRKDGEVEAAK